MLIKNRHLQSKLLFLFLIIHSSLAAQRNREVPTLNHVWTSINSQMRLTDKWAIAADVHIRRTNYLQKHFSFHA
jgi:hypothetical protein